MKNTLRTCLLAGLLLLGWTSPMCGAELKAGGFLRFEFPELPDTLYTMHTGKKTVPMMSVRLPVNYSKDGKFPLFIWLFGGTGGDGSGCGAGRTITEDKDYIFVGMPLFKKTIVRDEPYNGLAIQPKRDADVICAAMGTMLRKLYETIPNIDTSQNAIGGTSNGAHSIAAIFYKGDAYLMERLHNLILAEGGFWLNKVENLKGKRLLIMYGDQGGDPRAAIIKDATGLIQKAQQQKIDVTGFVMENTGHDLPKKFMPNIKDWLFKGREGMSDSLI